MRKLKYICFSLVFSIIISLCACSTGTQSSVPETSVSKDVSVENRNFIKLLYSSSDTFNPYTAVTDTNRQLCDLLYDSLVKLDNNFNPVYKIADTVKTENKKCTVSLKQFYFSDGSVVSANDVAYSFKLAKASNTSYGLKLYEAASVNVLNSTTVQFNLTKNDPYFVNVLDFPILKSGTDEIKNSDSVIQPPVGGGRFKVSEDRTKLVKNERYPMSSSITEIRLINAPDAESVAHFVEIGAADMYYSNISDGKILRMSGKKQNINLNNLVYLGFNSSYADLSQNTVRQIFSTAIDRKKISRDVFYNNAVASTGFYNPAWETVRSVQNIQTEANDQITIENLKEIGYNNIDSKGVRLNSSGGAIRYNLLVNSDNQIRVNLAETISKQLLRFGIVINIVKKPYESYIASLTSGDFQLYLGEVFITDNMDLSSVVLEGGSAAYGIKNPAPVVSDDPEKPAEQPITLSQVFEQFYSGVNNITDVASTLQTEMPIVPICYRTGVLFYNDNMQNINTSSVSDIFFSFETYSVKK